MPRPRTFDEADVVAAARDAFWTRGYAATSVEDLTAATGLGKGSLYGAFGDKHRLFLRALDDYVAAAMDGVRAELRDPKHTAYDRLERHLRSQARIVASNPPLRGCMMAKSAAELSATDADVEQKIAHAFSEWHTLLTSCLREAQRDGTIDPKQSAATLATLLLGVLRGLEALHKAGNRPAQLKAAAEAMIGLLPRG